MVHLTRPHYTVMTLGHIMQTPLSAMPPPQPDKVETQHLASPGGTMHLSSSQICMIILPWFSRETQDFASLHGCRRQSSIEGMRSIHRIHGKVETQHLASPDEPMHLSSSSYSIHITMFLQYCPTPTASRYAAWRAVRCKCWQSYRGHLQLNDI